MLIVLIFICGFFIGNVLEWISYRIPKEENSTFSEKLKRCCKYAKKITNKRVIIGCMIGIIYCLFYLKYKISIDFFRYSLVCSILFIVALIDYKTQNVYFSTTFIAALLSIIFIVISHFTGINISGYILGGVYAGVFSVILAAFNVIGWGDVEIFIICGLLVGTYKLIIVIFISIILCGTYGISNLIINAITKKKSKLRVAFGPYIVISLIAVIIFGSNIH